MHDSNSAPPPPTPCSFVHLKIYWKLLCGFLFLSIEQVKAPVQSPNLVCICFKVILKKYTVIVSLFVSGTNLSKRSRFQLSNIFNGVCACVRACVLSQQVTLVRAWLRTSSSFAGWFFSTFSSPLFGSSSFFYLKSSTAATQT